MKKEKLKNKNTWNKLYAKYINEEFKNFEKYF